MLSAAGDRLSDHCKSNHNRQLPGSTREPTRRSKNFVLVIYEQICDLKKLNSVRQTGEREISDFHGRNHTATGAHRLAHCLYVIQHHNRALIETEIFNRKLDLAIFYVKSAVSGKSRVEQSLAVHIANVPETRH